MLIVDKPDRCVRLECGDLETTLPQVAVPGTFDAIVTSPPYNLGIKYGTFDDSQPRDSYLLWCRRWLEALLYRSHAGTSLFLNLGSKPSSPSGPYDVLREASRAGWVLQNQIAWVKSLAIGATTFGHYKPINSPRYLNDTWEFVFHLTRTGSVELDRVAVGVPFMDKSNLKRGTRGQHGDLRCAGNVWFIPYDTIQSRSKDRATHPATFPEALVERCLRLHGLTRCRSVLDPFNGVGTTTAVAARLGVPMVVGIELDEGYHRAACERVRQVTT